MFDRFAASGLGVGAFCAREGISDSSFGRWRSLLGDAGQVTGTATAVERTGFVDAGRIGLSGDERIEVKLELGVEAALRRKPPALRYLIADHPAITPIDKRLPRHPVQTLTPSRMHQRVVGQLGALVARIAFVAGLDLEDIHRLQAVEPGLGHDHLRRFRLASEVP